MQVQARTIEESIDVDGLFRGLVGRWLQVRTITPGGSFAGEAVFVPIGDVSLHYAETGLITLDDGQRLTANRRYIFTLQGPRIAVAFDERPPRLFHRLEFKGTPSGCPVADASHRCGADDYLSTYTILTVDAFTVTHRVIGPRKDYVMRTEYARIGARGAP